MPAPELLTDQSALEACCSVWRAAGRFAFDSEFIRDDTYDSLLCLLQVAGPDGVVLVDPLSGLDLAPFWTLVSDPAVIKVVHAGKEDLEVAFRLGGSPPRNVFDVQIACGLTGHGYPLSLLRLVAAVTGRRLEKDQTLTDWQRRPLTDDQLLYAVADVAHLLDAHDRLARDLERRGRTGWLAEEMSRFEDPLTYAPPIANRMMKLKGMRKLDSLGLAVLERLIAWREAWAAEKNRPVRAMMRDDVLVEIARRRPRKATDLEVLRGFPQARNPRVVDAILELIEAARSIPRDQLPEVEEFREETPSMRVVVDVVAASARAICLNEDVSFDLLGGLQKLRELLDHLSGRRDETPALLRGWRAEFVGGRLVDLLEGRCELHLSGWPSRPRLSLETPGGAPRNT